MADAVQTASLALQAQMGASLSGTTSSGAWAIGTAYVPGNIVTRSGSSYLNLIANTGADPATDTSGIWLLVTGNAASAASLLTLSSAIVSGAQTVAVARQARRVGLLAAVSTPAVLPPGSSLGLVAQTWNEVREAANFLAGAMNLDSQLSVLRSFDTRGPLTGVIANVPAAAYTVWGNLLVASAAAYETLLGESLPA